MNSNASRFLAISVVLLLTGSCSQVTTKETSVTVDPPSAESFSFSYQISVPTLPTGAKSVEIIVPSPPSDDNQTISNFRISSNLNDSQYFDPEYKNNILVFNSGDLMPESVDITMTFDVVRKQRAPIDSLQTANHINSHTYDLPDSLRKYTLPNTLVPLDGPIQREADSLLSANMPPLEIARALYDHLFETMAYDKSGTGWGKGDALYACDARRGNCTDIHSLFIGMARSQGIPARFKIGFPLPEDMSKEKSTIPGYHCWAEFYLENEGWIPVDISEAIKNPQKRDYYFGRLDAHRIGFTVGRDIIAPTRAGERAFNYLIYPQVFVDGKKFDEVERIFTVSKT